MNAIKVHTVAGILEEGPELLLLSKYFIKSFVLCWLIFKRSRSKRAEASSASTSISSLTESTEKGSNTVCSSGVSSFSLKKYGN
jgi:hypothetical protein